MKIGIYGTKVRGMAELQKCTGGGHDVCFIETAPKQTEVEGIPVYAAADAGKLDCDEFHIANRYVEEIVENLRRAGVPEEKIVIPMPHVMGDGNLVLRHLRETGYAPQLSFDAGLVLTRVMSFVDGVPYTERLRVGHNQWFFSDDYCRYGTLRLLAKQIEEDGIGGDVAELGVFQGKLSYCINLLFPERRFWLFDTFEGFAGKNLSEEERQKGIREGHFSDTSEEHVLSRLPHRERCIVRKGLFPSTIPEKDVTYALVSLDCDLYEPALEGLRYFYAHLAPGGYILLHDYQSTWYTGIHEAVQAYEKEHGRLVKVPLPDEAGTIVIQKPFA